MPKAKLKAGTRVSLDLTTLTIMRLVLFHAHWELKSGELGDGS